MAVSMRRPFLSTCLVFIQIGVTAAGSSAAQVVGRATPVEKVIDLLTKLSAQLEEEAKTEAAEYDKYSCFCKVESDKKQTAIEKSTKRIAAMGARIVKLEADMTSLTTDITDLGTTISGFEEEITNATSQREKQHQAYLIQEADTAGAITAINGAIKALKDAKGDMEGRVEVESLAQVEALATHVTVAAAYSDKAIDQLEALSDAIKGHQPDSSYTYRYHSNDVIALLEGLRGTFMDTLRDLNSEESALQTAFDKKKLGLENEKKFATQDRQLKQMQADTLGDTLANTKKNKLAETAAMKADQEFLTSLTDSCEQKATFWDQRSKSRAAEITAISKALEVLKSGVSSNWSANKKLVDVQTESKSSPTFLQLRGQKSDIASEGAAVKKALDVLTEAASQSSSPSLAAIVLKARASEDHFVKVRGLIKDLIAKLEQMKKNEQDSKGFCDTKMLEATASRDKEKGRIETYNGKIFDITAAKAKLEADVAQLQQGIADNLQALNEAQELRVNEKAENKKTIEDANAGKDAVEMAISILKQFYEGGSLSESSVEDGAELVQRSVYVPPKADREGKTVEDRAPESFDSEYHGNKEASKGILGMLEVILADFDRTGTAVETDEKMSEEAFESFKATTEKDTETKKRDIKSKQKILTGMGDDLIMLQDKLKEADKLHGLAIDALLKLQSMCVAGEESYDERVAKRAKEIEALKEALQILEDWKK